jgi:hypothetical protein
MKAIHWIIAAAAFAFVQPAQAGINDPEVIIYRFPGVLDNGGGTFFLGWRQSFIARTSVV